jgi:endonuclease/exonuclease/phosphatase family metal-dependent hydrolase
LASVRQLHWRQPAVELPVKGGDIVPSDSIRIASFNVENLFARPKVFNFHDKSIGDDLMARIEAFRRILKKPSYTDADKRKLVGDFTTGEPETSLAPLKDFITVREDRGKLWKMRGWAIAGVKADGAGDWDGTIEFRKARFSQAARENTGKVIRSVKADIACIIEADHRPALKSFDSEVLKYQYAYEMLIDGNDARGIDVGLYSRFPLGVMRTHMFDGGRRSKIFSRDCPEYEIILPSGESLFILCNHLKSKGYGDTAKSNARRKRQAEAIRDILRGYDLRNDCVVVAGDLNDTPESAPLKPLMKTRNLYDVLKLQFPRHPRKRWTYHYRSFEQIDYLLVSRPLKDRFIAAGVDRRGMYDLHNLTAAEDDIDTETEFDTVTHWTNAASDHGAVWADFDLSS